MLADLPLSWTFTKSLISNLLSSRSEDTMTASFPITKPAAPGGVQGRAWIKWARHLGVRLHMCLCVCLFSLPGRPAVCRRSHLPSLGASPGLPAGAQPVAKLWRDRLALCQPQDAPVPGCCQSEGGRRGHRPQVLHPGHHQALGPDHQGWCQRVLGSPPELVPQGPASPGLSATRGRAWAACRDHRVNGAPTALALWPTVQSRGDRR